MTQPLTPRARAVERGIALVFATAILVWSQLPVLWAWRAQWRGDHPNVEFTGALHTYAD